MKENQIGTRLSSLREKKAVSQKEVAEILGITQTAYGKIEAGQRGLSSEYCVRLADYYETTCDYLLRGIDAEYVDFCEKTGLTQDTINYLIQRRKAIKDNARSLTDKEDRVAKLYYGDDHQAIVNATLDYDTALYDEAVSIVRQAIMNKLLQNEKFLTEIEESASILASCVDDDDEDENRLHSPPDTKRDRNAAHYAAAQALSVFLTELSSSKEFREINREAFSKLGLMPNREGR